MKIFDLGQRWLSKSTDADVTRVDVIGLMCADVTRVDITRIGVGVCGV